MQARENECKATLGLSSRLADWLRKGMHVFALIGQINVTYFPFDNSSKLAL